MHLFVINHLKFDRTSARKFHMHVHLTVASNSMIEVVISRAIRLGLSVQNELAMLSSIIE